MMRKMWLLAVLVVFILSCSMVTGIGDSSSEPNTCYSEQNLTEEECDNAGTHTFHASGRTDGIGGTECEFNDGSSFLEKDVTQTIQFTGDGEMVLDHPDDEIWGQTTHVFQRLDTNTYRFNNDPGMEWTVTFFWWGFQEELVYSYDCEAGTCGCRMSVENRRQ